MELPTAVHAVVDTQDTPERVPFAGPGGLVVGWIAQLVPFHPSASVALLPAPTAAHAAAAAQDTLDRPPPPLMRGVLWTLQPAPFDSSATAPVLPLLPTAVQAVAAQDTSYRLTLRLPLGLTVDWTDHALPFHCSTSVPALNMQPGGLKQLHDGCPFLQRTSCQFPTPVHALVPVHDTPYSSAEVAPAGMAIFWLDHALPSQR